MTVVNSTAPTISGTTRQGQTLTASPGTWTFDLDYLSYTYQWERCDSGGGSCVDIVGATNVNYVLTAADVGSRLRVEVTATEHSFTPTPGGEYFNGNFDTCNLSQWSDFHDAHLPSGVVTVSSPRYGGTGCSARITVTDNPDSSQGGDATVLWAGNGSNSYDLAWLQNGQSTWFRTQFILPSATFKVSPVGGGWDIIMEWHSNVNIVPSAYSTIVQIAPGGGVPSDPACIQFRPVGGLSQADQKFTYLYQTNGAPQTQANRIPVLFDHWYDIVVHLTFAKSAAAGGAAEWWINNVAQDSVSCATLVAANNGSVPGVGFEVGLYRGPSQPQTDVIYVDGTIAGPTAASIGFTP